MDKLRAEQSRQKPLALPLPSLSPCLLSPISHSTTTTSQMLTYSSKSPSNSDPESQELTSLAAKSSWTPEDERNLLEFLIERRATMTDAQMFKSQVFRAAAVELNKSLTRGGAKTENSCKAKWSKVRHLFCYCIHNLTLYAR